MNYHKLIRVGLRRGSIIHTSRSGVALEAYKLIDRLADIKKTIKIVVQNLQPAVRLGIVT